MPKKIFFSLIPFLVFWFLAEIAVRLFFPQTVRTYVRDSRLGARLYPGAAGQMVSDEFRVLFQANALGFNDVDHAVTKPPGTYRILLLGDSFVEGLQVNLSDSYPRQLETWLNQHRGASAPFYEVLAMGISGFGTAQAWEALKKYGLPLQPDLVLLHFFPANDFRNNHPDLEFEYARPFYRRNPANGLLELEKKSVFENQGALGDYLYKKSCQLCLLIQNKVGELAAIFSDARPDQKEVLLDYKIFTPAPPAPWDEAKVITHDLILAIRDTAVRAGADFGMVILANRAQVHPEVRAMVLEQYPALNDYPLDWELPNRELIAFCGQENLTCHDLLAPFRRHSARTGEVLFFIHDGHWNQYGHRLVASEVGEWIHSEF